MLTLSTFVDLKILSANETTYGRKARDFMKRTGLYFSHISFVCVPKIFKTEELRDKSAKGLSQIK
jgi:hypothetical protein